VGAVSDTDLAKPTVTRPERLLAALAAVALMLLCVIVTTTVIVRALGFQLIPDDVLLVQELMVWIIVLPLASVVALRQQIAITIFTERAGPNTKAVLSLLGHAVGLLFVGALFWVASGSLIEALESGEYYDGELYLPTWTGYSVFALGLGVFLARLLAMTVIDLRALLNRMRAG